MTESAPPIVALQEMADESRTLIEPVAEEEMQTTQKASYWTLEQFRPVVSFIEND
jgi:hypothetical protein